MAKKIKVAHGSKSQAIRGCLAKGITSPKQIIAMVKAELGVTVSQNLIHVVKKAEGSVNLPRVTQTDNDVQTFVAEGIERFGRNQVVAAMEKLAARFRAA